MRDAKRSNGLLGLVLAAVLTLGLTTAGVSAAMADPAETDPPAVEDTTGQPTVEGPDETEGQPSEGDVADQPATSEADQPTGTDGAEPAVTDDTEPATDADEPTAAPLRAPSPSSLSSVPEGTTAGDLVGGERVAAVEESIKNSDGVEILKTTIAVKGGSISDDNIYPYRTSESAKYVIAISNSDNMTMSNVVRVYFAYDGDGQQMGTFPAGETYNLVNPQGSIYPMKVVETEVPNVFYYEITGIKPGETLSFDNSVAYPSPGTPGGTLRIWATTITSDEAEELEGKVIDPSPSGEDLDYLELNWYTKPLTYNITKTNNSSPSISVNAAGEAPVTNLTWRIVESNASGSSSTSTGQDHILRVDYTDVIDLPETLMWRPEVLALLENDTRSSSNSTEDGWWVYYSYSDAYLRVRSNGTVYDVAHIYRSSGGNVTNVQGLTPQIVTEGGEKKLKLTWYCTNSSSVDGESRQAEYTTQSFYLYVGSNVLLADLDKLAEVYEADPSNLSNLIKVSNDASETRTYSYSDPQTSTAQTATQTIKVDTGWQVTKNWQVIPTGSRGVYGGDNDYSTISIKDTGILPIKVWGTQENPNRIIADTLDTHFYIKPENIVSMLNATTTVGTGEAAQTVPLGNWLTITINHASLFDTDYYIPSAGADQDNKYTKDTNIYASNDVNARVFEDATFTITKDAQGRIVVKLEGDTEESNNGTYVIGQDYESIDALFEAVGYFPTRNTTYDLSYVVDGPFVLNPGQILNVSVLSTCKTTPMMLTVDTEDNLYYSSSASSSETSNQATVSATVAGTVTTARPKTYRTSYSHHYWAAELYVRKTGTTDSGSSYSSGSSLPEGTVLNNCIHGYNRGSYHYDYMQFADYMYGAEVLLVPVNENPGLAGKGLDTYTSNGVEYYLMNKDGTYENIIVGSTTKNGTQTFKATTITVSKSGSGTSGSLNTTIEWEPIANWNNDTNIYYKSIASAYWAGLVSSEGTSSGNTYYLGNRAWLGDHQGHRLYDTYGLFYNSFSYGGKSILNDDGSTTKSSRITNGETVTYVMTIKNITSTPVTISASMLRDALPNTYGVFTWEKGANVTNLRYSAPEGSTITAGGHSLNIDGTANDYNDYWRVVSSRKAPTRYSASGSNAYEGGWDILWDSDFQVSLAANGELKIYVDLTYPARAEDDDTWDKYVATTKGAPIYNYFYFNDSPSSVSHTLEAEGRPVLYKGVYDTGLTTHTAGTNDYDYGTYTSNKSRLRYVNGGGGTPSKSDPDLKVETITYYTVLYNGSYDRLYISDLQDVLPRGFTFNSFCNNTNAVTVVREWSFSSNNSRSNYTEKSSTYRSYNPVGWAGNVFADSDPYTLYQVFTEGTSNGSPLVTVDNSASSVDENTIKYVNARVTAVPMDNAEDGCQHLTFVVSGATSNARSSSQPTVHYDAEAGMYYLNPGEAIRFGYNCLIDSYANTDDFATNTIAMPYYDYYGTGFDLHVPDEEDGGATQTVRSMSGITNNDGGCELMTDEEVADLNMSTDDVAGVDAYHTHEDGNWLVSDVTVERADVTPGIIKTVGGTSQKPTNSSATPGSLGTSNSSMNGGDSSRFGSRYTYSCSSSNIINWRLCLYNEAGGINDDITGMMSNYRVVDTVAAPYGFTGRVFYNLFRSNASTSSPANFYSIYLFTLGQRTVGDTSVRIGTGTNLTTDLAIGSAEDDDDDQWYEFGTGTQAGRVKIERDADGNEVMTIDFIGATYSIPGGCYIELALHTQFNANQVIISEGKYNDAVLYPEQDYDALRVVQGRARTKQAYDKYGNAIQVNDGVQSGASVMLVQGYTSSSWKIVTQNGNTSNTARSDESNNYINLEEKTNTFRYDLFVVGPEDVMAKIVVIDALPQEGDHSAFVDADKRYSDFTVSIDEENPGFTVSLIPKGGKETALKPGEYHMYVSTRTEFEREDWQGAGDDWTEITDLTGDELAAALEGARSLRVVIEDSEAYKVLSALSDYRMANQCQVHIGFNARVDDPEAYPGEYAWNSFGYTYTVPLTQNGTEENSTGIALDAQPLNAGVRYPSAPSLEKRLAVLEQKMEPKTEEVEVPVLDEEGNPVLDEDGNPVTETEVRVVTEPVEYQVYDTETGEPLYDDEGNPVTEIVDEPVMVPVVDEDGNAVMELVDHPATEDLTFGFIVYEGESIPALDNAFDMEAADIAAVLEEEGRTYIYVPLTVKEGDVSAKVNLWTIDFASTYDTETGEFVSDEDVEWHWQNLNKYTVLEMPVGDYFYTLYSFKLGAAEHVDENNLTFTNGNSSILAIVGTNEWAPEYVDITGEKVWDDEDNLDGSRPKSITIHLLADGEEVGTAEVSADTDWKFSFDHLLKYHENGDLIQYQVVEDAVDGYSVVYKRTEVEGEVQYVVEDDEEPVEAETPLLLSLLGLVDDSDEADETDEPSEPEVQTETTVVGYDFTITNSHTPVIDTGGATPPSSKKHVVPATGDSTPLGAMGFMFGLGAAALAVGLAIKRRNQR